MGKQQQKENINNWDPSGAQQIWALECRTLPDSEEEEKKEEKGEDEEEEDIDKVSLPLTSSIFRHQSFSRKHSKGFYNLVPA